MPDETTAALAQAEADKKALQAQVARLQKYADEDVKRFLASEEIVKRVGLTARGPAEMLLTDLARMEADGTGTVKLASGGDSTLYALAKAVIESLPPQVTATEEREIALAGGGDGPDNTLPQVAGFLERHAESDDLWTAAKREQAKATAQGQNIKFAEAVERITRQRSGVSA